jgi:ligand-binding sensor domain-containing protein
MLKLFYIVWLIILTVKLNAQNPIITKIDNLPFDVKSINCIATEENIVWIGTNRGILKLTDGKVEQFFDENNPGKFKINRIAVDELGVKWLGTYSSSLIQFTGKMNDDEISFLELTNNQQQLITAVIVIKNIVWLTTSEGLILSYEPATKKKSIHNSPVTDNLFAINLDESGTQWVASASGLYQSDDGNKWTLDKSLMQSFGIFTNKRETYTIGMNHKRESMLMNYSSKKKRWKEIPLEGLPDKSIKFNDMAFDTFGNYWMATNYGVIKYDIGKSICIQYNKAFYKNLDIREVKTISLQNDNIIWISSSGSDLFKIELDN